MRACSLGLRQKVAAVAFRWLADGLFIAMDGEDQKLRLWKKAPGSALRGFAVENDVDAVSFSLGGRYAAILTDQPSSLGDSVERLSELSHRLVSGLPPENLSAEEVAELTAKGVLIQNTLSGALAGPFNVARDVDAPFVAVTPDAKYVLVRDFFAEPWLLDLATKKYVPIEAAKVPGVLVSSSPDVQYIAKLHIDNTVNVWKTLGGEVARVKLNQDVFGFVTEQGYFWDRRRNEHFVDVLFRLDDRFFVTLSDDKVARVAVRPGGARRPRRR